MVKQIFLVEDDLSLIGGLSFAVRKEGYEVDVARTTFKADALWSEGKYDLVILDVSLPDGSGFDLCRKMRLTSKVPIMFLTAADEETDMIMGLDCLHRKMTFYHLNVGIFHIINYNESGKIVLNKEKNKEK